MWLHFGAGNIFKMYLASLQQSLLNTGLSKSGIIVCDTFDEQIITKTYNPFDNLSIGVTLKSTGDMSKTVIASITETVLKSDMIRLREIGESPSLQMITFTVTEKGYSLKNNQGVYFPDVDHDIHSFSDSPKSLMGIIAYLCYCRFKAGKLPLALVSMDNFSHNGSVLKQTVMGFVDAWVDRGFVPAEFQTYMNDENSIYFPWTMIDKITPRPSKKIEKLLADEGIENAEIVVTDKNSYVSLFVNAEETEYLAIEDKFPNGRPPLEKSGVLFGTQTTIDQIEKMKVCVCLNPLHTALAIYGCLLGYTLISEAVKNPCLLNLIKKIGYIEGLPVVVDPKIINPREFIDAVVHTRLPNPYMMDTPQRIACDTSQKLAIRFGETIKCYIKGPIKNVGCLKFIPLVFAGWLRYLMGLDDEGKPFELSPDPRLEEMQAHIGPVKLGDKNISEYIKPILSDEAVFGVDLYQSGLAGLTEEYFIQLISGKGAVKKTLEKYLK